MIKASAETGYVKYTVLFLALTNLYAVRPFSIPIAIVTVLIIVVVATFFILVFGRANLVLFNKEMVYISAKNCTQGVPIANIISLKPTWYSSIFWRWYEIKFVNAIGNEECVSFMPGSGFAFREFKRMVNEENRGTGMTRL